MRSSNQTLTQLTADRLEHLKQLIDNAKPAISEMSDKNIIMLMGVAGSGTDILASRLEGKKLLLKKDELSEQIRAIDEDHPHGRNISVPRLLKSVITLENKTFFCECPEFSTNQTISEEAIAKSITLEDTITNAKRIRGMIFTIDYSHFTSKTLESIKNLISTLNKLLPPNSKEVRHSVAFVVIQKPISKTVDETHKAIISAIEKEIVNIDSTELTWWSLLKSNLIIMDFKDMAASNKAILDKVCSFSEIKSTEFNFTDYDYSRKALINAVNDTAFEMELAKQLEEKFNHAKECAQDLNKLEEENKEIENEIEQKTSERSSLREEIRTKKDILRNIERKNNLVKYWFEDLHEARNPIYKLGFAGYSEKKFEYDSIPFDEVKLAQKNGYFVNESIDKEKGKYSVTYKSHFGYTGEAHVEIYVKENQLPENQAVIATLKEAIETKAKKKDQCDTELEELHENNQKLQERISELRKNTVDTMQQIELEMKLSKLQQTIENSKDAFSVIIKYFDDFNIPQPDFSDPLYKLVSPAPEPIPIEEALSFLSMFAKKQQTETQHTEINVDGATNEVEKKQMATL